MDKERRNNGDYYYTVDPLMTESNFSLPISPPPSSAGTSVTVTTGVGYIEHTVSKFDTLAGVAIKYGVEVADIKKMNGLVTDLQMFALKSLHIPLPGRHPPSPILANGIHTPGPSDSEHTPATRRHSDLFDSFQSLRLKSSPQRRVSPAMSSLQGYYGLKQKDRSNALGQSCEMAVYRKEGSHYLEDGPLGKASSPAPTLGLHRKSKSLAYGLSENGDVENNNNTMSVASENWIDKLIRRRQKSEADFNKCTTEKLLKEDNSSGGFSTVAGKGLALRPKAAAASRTSDPDAGGGWPSPFPLNLGDSSADSNSGVRKSSSTPSFLDQDNNNKDNSNAVSSSSSIWPTSKWSLKSDLQALSTAAIAMPIFDGLPKPITGRKNKAALD